MIRSSFLVLSVAFFLIISCAKNLQPINYNASVHKKADDAFRELDSSDRPNPNTASKQSLQNSAKPIIITKYPIINGAPVWLAEPNIAGYKFTAIGSSKPDAEGLSIQKKKARMYAYAELSKTVNVYIENELNISSLVVNSELKKSDITSTSRQRSNEVLANQVQIDEWYDNKTDEYFVLIGVSE